MKIRLTKLHEPGKNYMIRVCMTTAEAITTVPTSVIKNCMECDTPVWYDEAQVVPSPPSDYDVEPEEILLCLTCTAIHGALDDEPMIWLTEEQ